MATGTVWMLRSAYALQDIPVAIVRCARVRLVQLGQILRQRPIKRTPWHRVVPADIAIIRQARVNVQMDSRAMRVNVWCAQTIAMNTGDVLLLRTIHGHHQ